MIYRDRPYQQRDIPRIRTAFASHRRVLYVACCGSGKTVVFSKVAEGAMAKNKVVNIMAHRKELITQCSSKLTNFGVDHGIIKSGFKPEYDKPIQVSSVQTLIHHLDDIREPDMFVPDEAHHSQNKTQQTILSKYPRARILGVTASPIFGNGRSLGGYYDELIQGPQVAELVDDGYLVPIRVYAPPPIADLTGVDYGSEAELEAAMNKRTITGDAIVHYTRLAAHKPAIVYVVNIKHGEAVAQQFREAGYKFQLIEGTMPGQERDKLLADFASGEIEGLVSCDLISEGTDVPHAMVAIKLRPTKSLGWHIQSDGRINRPFYAPGMPLDTADQRKAAIAASVKPYGIIIDHVNNLYFHGWPDDEFIWSLTEPPIQRRAGGLLIPMQQCASCYAHFKPADACPYCGAVVIKKERKLVYTKGELIELKKAEAKAAAEEKARAKAKKAEDNAREERLKKQRLAERKLCKSYDQLVAHGEKWGFKDAKAWAGIQIKQRNKWRSRR